MPSRPNPVSTWSEYFSSMLDKPLHPLYGRLSLFLASSGFALELGAGVGHGVLYLLSRGYRVVAVDAEEEACAILRERAPEAEVVEGRFEDLSFALGAFDVVVAGFSLFFLSGAELSAFWPRMVGWLKPGGVFAGEFLGLRDDWVGQGYLGHREDEVRGMLAPFEILYWEEAERDGKTSQGTDKHWHVYHVVARLSGY